MFSPILALLFGLALIHTSMAIKCIAQPDIEEEKKFKEEQGKMGPAKFKQEWLRMLKTSGEVDCAEVARKYGLAEPTHCVSTDDLSTCPGIVRSYARYEGVAPEELRGIKMKECHFEQQTIGNIRLLSNKKGASANSCYLFEEEFGCRECRVCNENDFCNADTEMNTTIGTNQDTTEGKGRTEVTEKPEEKRIQVESMTIGTNEENGTTEGKSTTEVTDKPEENGAGLPGGAPQALFLSMLLAIATGAFRWAASH